MSRNASEDAAVYKIVTNYEEQYSIWPEHKEVPRGWKQVGKTGLKRECLAWIKDVWTDMRPPSLRNKMEDLANSPTAPRDRGNPLSTKSLVDRLGEKDSPIEMHLLSESTFQQAIDCGYVHITFTQTLGGTELGFRLGQETSDVTAANIENRTGSVHLEGTLTLDYVRVKCVTNIDLGR